MQESPFKILGIPEGSSLDECKKAYRRLVKKYHPDINKYPEAIKKFLAIQSSYDIVSGKQTKPQIPQEPIYQQQTVVVYRVVYTSGSTSASSGTGTGWRWR